MNAADLELANQMQSRLGAAEAAIGRADWSSANALLLDGIGTLGDRYQDPRAIDDTEMSLVLAEAEEQAGHLDASASLRRDVLASRLTLLRRR